MRKRKRGARGGAPKGPRVGVFFHNRPRTKCRGGWKGPPPAATASAGFGRSTFHLRLPHHLHPTLTCSPCCVSWRSNRGHVAGATGDGAHRQHSRIVLRVPPRLTTGGPDSSLMRAPHLPAPHRWHTPTPAPEAHPLST